jgi:DNA-binding MarR family transcriptional regulator
MKDKADDLLEVWSAEFPGADARVDGIVTRMQLLVRHLGARKAVALERLGLQMWECATLYALCRRGKPFAAGPTELAAELGITGAAMTTRVDTMQRRGYVTRRYDRTDRRRSVIVLTRHGLSLAKRVIAAQDVVERELVAVLSVAQQDQLSGLLRRLMRAAESAG